MTQYMSVVCMMDILLGGESASICPHSDALLSVSDILFRCLKHFCTLSRPTMQ
jgi:hypothetical protein